MLLVSKMFGNKLFVSLLFINLQFVNKLGLLKRSVAATAFFPTRRLFQDSPHILFLSDTRMNDKKIQFLEKSFCKSSIIGSKKQRLFSTSCNSNNKTGGVSIFIPDIYDEVLKVVHVEKDTSPIPRHILVVVQIVGGPKVIMGAVYGAPGGKVDERAKVFRNLYNQIYKTSNLFATSILFLAGDFNIPLDKLSDQAKNKMALSKIIQDFCLNDACQNKTSQLPAIKMALRIIQRSWEIAQVGLMAFSLLPSWNPM